MLTALLISFVLHPRLGVSYWALPCNDVSWLTVTEAPMRRHLFPNCESEALGQDELKRLLGSWSLRRIQVDAVTVDTGCSRAERDQPAFPLVSPRFEGDKLLLSRSAGRPSTTLCSIRINPLASPKTIDLVRTEGTFQGIYDISADVLRICVDVDPVRLSRPTSFDPTGTRSLVLLVYSRVAEAGPKAEQMPRVVQERKLDDANEVLLQKVAGKELRIMRETYHDMATVYSHGLAISEKHLLLLRGSRLSDPSLDPISKVDDWCKGSVHHKLRDYVLGCYNANVAEAEGRVEFYKKELGRMNLNILLIDVEIGRRSSSRPQRQGGARSP